MCPSQPSNMSNSPPPPSSSSIWLLTYIKLQFFGRIRRFLRSKTARKRYGSTTDRFDIVSIKGSSVDDDDDDDHEEAVVIVQVIGRETSDDHDSALVLQRSVKKLHFGSWEEKEKAAKMIERLAKEDGKTKKLMAQLEVIPVLVAMVASEVPSRRLVGITTLIELANGTYT